MKTQHNKVANNGSNGFSGGVKMSQRSQKTLGWYLSEEILEKTGSQSPPVTTTTEAAAAAANQAERGAAARKRRGGRRGRKLTESLSTASEGSLAEMAENRQPRPFAPPAASLAEEMQPSRDDFYYYDAATDGYYYEQSGAKGWRRRLPNPAADNSKKIQAKVAEEQQQLQTQQQRAAMAAAAAAAAAIAAAAATQQQAAFFPPQLRYYDAASDGFFYEMASVDGWRRRQPAAASPFPDGRFPSLPVSAPSRSYGATLARGEMPAKCIVDTSSASSSVSEELLGGSALSRPSSLSLSVNATDEEEDAVSDHRQLLTGFDADKFIEDLVGRFSSEQLEHIDISTPRTPECSRWARRWLPAHGEAAHSTAKDAEDVYALQKELEKIWLTPTGQTA